MRRPKYPLTSLVDLRARQVDEATRALAESTRAREDAERARQVQERVAAEHAASTERVKEAERAALARGELRVSNLLAQQAWSMRAQAEQAELDARTARAKVAEATRRREEAVARDATARRKADADVVQKDRARFEQGLAKRVEAAEEEDALDAWNGGRRG